MPTRRLPDPSAGMPPAWCRAPLLLALAVGCHSWRAEPVLTEGAPPRALRGRVRATRTDGTRLELTRARIADDTLRGDLRAGNDDGAERASVAVPLNSVREIERRRFSVARTVGAYFGVMGVVFVGMHAVGSETGGSAAR